DVALHSGACVHRNFWPRHGCVRGAAACGGTATDRREQDVYWRVVHRVRIDAARSDRDGDSGAIADGPRLPSRGARWREQLRALCGGAALLFRAHAAFATGSLVSIDYIEPTFLAETKLIAFSDDGAAMVGDLDWGAASGELVGW